MSKVPLKNSMGVGVHKEVALSLSLSLSLSLPLSLSLSLSSADPKPESVKRSPQNRHPTPQTANLDRSLLGSRV
jgi:hypothetical protein